MVFLDEACIHQFDMKILRSRVVVLREVFLDKVCIQQVDAAQGLSSRSRKKFIDKVADVLVQLKFQQSKVFGCLEFSSSTDCGHFSCAQRGIRTVQTVQTVEIPQVQSFVPVEFFRFVHRRELWRRRRVVCRRFYIIFRTPSICTSTARLAATFFRALDDQQLLVVEGSRAVPIYLSIVGIYAW